jgi:hypothetical protein
MLVKDPAAQLIEHPFVASADESQLWSSLSIFHVPSSS